MAEETQIYKKNYEDDTKFYRKNYGKDAKFYRNNLGKDAKFYRKNYKTDNKDTNKDIELLKTRIKKHEGNAFGEPVLIPYYLEYDDANGNHIKEDWLTGGWGTKLSKNHKEPEGGYTKEYWEKRFDERFDIAHKGAIELLGAAELEKSVDSIKNPFFRDGVQMVVDGYSLDELTEILETRIEYREVREKTQAGLFKSMGTMAPAWGMIGTLIGLVIMLSGFGGEGGADSLGPVCQEGKKGRTAKRGDRRPDG